MAFVATNKGGAEWVFHEEPFRWSPATKDSAWDSTNMGVRLPKGSIRKLIGRELTWADEPVELKGE